MSFDEILTLAKRYDFAAVCMRASQAGIATPPEVIQAMRSQLDSAGLKVSMVTGDFAVPSNNDAGPDGLRWITPYLDVAERFGAGLIRICMKREEDIYWAQKASDEAAERKIRLAHQSHCGSLFETVDGAVKTLKAVGRPNFGIIYEPANWFISAQDYGRKAIEAVKPWLFNVYVQNHTLGPDGVSPIETWTRGVVRVNHIGIWAKGGVDFDGVMNTLVGIGYNGYVTIHQAFAGVMPAEESVRRSVEYLKPFVKG